MAVLNNGADMNSRTGGVHSHRGSMSRKQAAPVLVHIIALPVVVHAVLGKLLVSALLGMSLLRIYSGVIDTLKSKELVHNTLFTDGLAASSRHYIVEPELTELHSAEQLTEQIED